MPKKINLYALMFIISTFFASHANSQFKYRTFIKKQTQKEKYRGEAGKNKKRQQLQNYPFIYKYISNRML